MLILIYYLKSKLVIQKYALRELCVSDHINFNRI